jgi:pimeloyl-ACP methyl ester carboxylesterase
MRAMTRESATTQPRPDVSQAVAFRSAQDSGPSEGITPFFPDWVVPLQPEGTGRPVFVFPSADNEPMAIRIEAEVADRVGRDHPFWAFARDDSQRDLVRERGVAAVVAEYIAQMRAIQGKGPFLLTGHCIGGYAAWETARQLLDAGEEIAGILFYEVPIRPDFARVLPGHPPVHDTRNIMRLAHYYRPQALPIDLTYLMTETWQWWNVWAPWQEVVLGTFETIVLPDITLGSEEFRARRHAMVAQHVRDWIDKSEARLRGTSAPT